MWIFSRAGFFSAVEKGTKNDSPICVRARVRGDFDRLQKLYLPEMGAVTQVERTDYPYRIFCSRSQWERACAAMAKDIDYSNFKDMVAQEQGYERAHLYGEVWSAMYGAEQKLSPARKVSPLIAGAVEAAKRGDRTALLDAVPGGKRRRKE